MPPRVHSSSSEAQINPAHLSIQHQNLKYQIIILVEVPNSAEWPEVKVTIVFIIRRIVSSVVVSSLALSSKSPTTLSPSLNQNGDEEDRSLLLLFIIVTFILKISFIFDYSTRRGKIMSLHHHHHHQQQQQQQEPPPSSSSATATTTATLSSTHNSSSTAAVASSTSIINIVSTSTVHRSVRSSSTSPQQRYSSIGNTAQQQRQQFHHHHQYLPPRPPSTTSSGSISTGFPDDLQDEPLPPLPPPPPHSTSSVPDQHQQPSSFSFHPAHHHPHTLQYHRHSSPHSSAHQQQVHHHHHHHHFVPSSGGGASSGGRILSQISSPISSQPYQLQHYHHQAIHSATAHSLQLPLGATPGSSRAASRQTFVGDEGDEGEVGGGDEENLLLVDNSVGVQDAVYLDPVTTDNFLTNIVQRFKRDFIYTYVGEGTLLVSVNPYKPLSIFSPRVKAAYRNISNPFQLPPHIYGQLCLILQRNTSSLERPQTLLLTGESGSGKSTNLSYLLDFLSTKQEPSFTSSSSTSAFPQHHHAQPHYQHHQGTSRSRRNSGRSTSGGSTRGSYNLSTGSLHRHSSQQQPFQHVPSCPHSIQQQYYYQASASIAGGSGRASSLSLTAPSGGGGGGSTGTSSSRNMALTLLQGNFLLNAFGNCKTSKNWDASRFGKLVQLQIDFLGNVVGGRVLTYQLEKWRVQGPITNSNSGNSTPGVIGASPSVSGEPSSSSAANPQGMTMYERNFHIFYILLAGADSTTLKSLRLTRNMETYVMLNVKNHSSFLNASQTNPSTPFCPHDHYYQRKGSRVGSSCYEGCFQLIKTTLASILSSSSSSICADNVFKILAAILKLNNLVFSPVANIDGTEGCDVTNEQDLHDLAFLLNILPANAGPSVPSPSTPSNGSNNHNHQHPLKMILTTRRVTRSDGTVAQIELTASESSSHRNSLCISLYTRLFAWLTKQVSFSPANTATTTAASAGTFTVSGRATPASTSGKCPNVHTALPLPQATSKHNLLNIIDFYGFEVFQTNSLEQFLINFTNEKIQYVLADLRLRLLQEEFVKDGLEWITIDTAGASPPAATNPSNPPGKLIDLVEENCHGLLSIFANCGNDHDLERHFSRRFSTSRGGGTGGDEHKESTFPRSPGGIGGVNTFLVEYLHQSFRLRHWAGPVVYSTRHFATKNRDTLPPHLPHQLYSWTSDPLLRSLFSHDGRNPVFQESTTSSRLLATSNMELSLRNLFQKCSSSSKHHKIYYIRCLKPNELSQPAAELCELALLKHQVKYHRLIDFVRVYRDGFTYNLGAFEFLERYKLLSLNTWPNWRLPHDVKLGIQVLMKDLQMKEGFDWCFGGGVISSSPSGGSGENLKVYLKGQRILSELEDFRRERLDDLALLIQKIWKGYRDWKEYRRMKDAHGVICDAWKKYLQCKRKEQRKLWKQMKASVRIIQQRYILWKRRLFLKQLIGQVKSDLQLIGGVSGAGGGIVTVGGLCPSLVGASAILPSTGSMLSPISRDWPYSPSYLEEASFQLRRVFHRWRCRLYRSRFNETERAKMKEKVTASLLFKDKKSSYARSVSHPFLGDYIRLRQNSQWRRTTMMMMLQSASMSAQQQPSAAPLPTSSSAIFEQDPTPEGLAEGGGASGKKQLLPSQQLQIVFADLINKITRSSGKFLPTVLVVTTTQIMILDPRTLNIKYKIPASEVWRLSVSPYGDDICVIHLQQPMRAGGGSVMGPGESSGLFGGVLSDDDDAYYQFGEEPSPTGNYGTSGCVCSSSVRDSGGSGVPGGGFPGGVYYSAGGAVGMGIEPPSPSPQQSQCQPGSSGGCGLFGGGGDTDSGQYATSEVSKLTKGDLVFHTCHLIEMVTKIYLVVKNATGNGPEIIISNEFPAVFNNQRVQLCFRYSKAVGKSKKETEATQSEDRPQLSINPATQLLPDGSLPQGNPCGLPPIPPPPPPAATIAAGIGGKDEPVIPPSQIKITRKKSTRMEFLIGHTS